MTAALTIEHLRKTYSGGTQALRDVSFCVERGEFFGLLGPNGAGKTTLISCLAGLSTPTAGTITVCGIDAAAHRRAASMKLGVVPQEITFDPHLTVMETLRFQSGYWGLTKNERWIGEILERLGLSGKADSLVRALSGGMKRRVLVAQALVHRPEIIVLDEPTAGVDVELREALWEFIGELHGQGAAVILTTHYLAEAQAMCARVAIMNRGEIAAIDRTEALLSRFEGQVLKARVAAGTLPAALLSSVVRRHGADLVLRIGGAADAAEKLSAMTAAGVVLENLTIGRPDLEDVFLHITSEAAR